MDPEASCKLILYTKGRNHYEQNITFKTQQIYGEKNAHQTAKGVCGHQ